MSAFANGELALDVPRSPLVLKIGKEHSNYTRGGSGRPLKVTLRSPMRQGVVATVFTGMDDAQHIVDMVNGRGGAASRLHRIIDEMERTAHTSHGHTNGTWRELMDYFVAAFRSVAIDMGESWACDTHGAEVPLT